MSINSIMNFIHDKLGDSVDNYLIPPPIFEEMQGEFLSFEMDAGVLTTRFPVLKKYLNPYGTMQGGMLAAAVDNTLGPLSMLVAPQNVTRRLEMKYSRPATADCQYIIVEGRFLERKEKQLFFSARVQDLQGKLLARASATHWIVENL